MSSRFRMLEQAEDDPRTIPAPMGREDLNELVTLLYRAQGECFRRGLGAGSFDAALGLSLALLATAEPSRSVRIVL